MNKLFALSNVLVKVLLVLRSLFPGCFVLDLLANIPGYRRFSVCVLPNVLKNISLIFVSTALMFSSQGRRVCKSPLNQFSSFFKSYLQKQNQSC